MIVHDPCIFLFDTNDFGSQAGIGKSSVPDPWHFGVDPDPRIHASD
jgi:hypothetical protein